MHVKCLTNPEEEQAGESLAFLRSCCRETTITTSQAGPLNNEFNMKKIKCQMLEMWENEEIW